MPIVGGPWIGDRVAPKYWGRLLREWGHILDQYAKVSEGDMPEWQQERSHVGFLAAAAWRLGRNACALEEYRESDKRGDRCRCDLWISVRGGKSVCIEAKRHWLPVDSEEKLDETSRRLARAKHDLRRLKQSRKDKNAGMALCFVTVAVPASKLRSQSDRDRYLDALVPELRKRSGGRDQFGCVYRCSPSLWAKRLCDFREKKSRGPFPIALVLLGEAATDW